MVRPKNGSMASISTRVGAPSLPLIAAAASWPSSPSSAVTWPILRSMSPAATSARILLTLSGAPRNSSRRCTSVRRLAIGCRLSVQSSAVVAAADDRAVACRGRRPSCARRSAPTCPRRARCRGSAGAWAGTSRRRRAITTHFASKILPPSVATRNSGVADLLQRRHHLAEMEGRVERLDLLHQRVGEAVAGDVGNAGNVVDRLFRIKLGALAADLVEDVDQVRLDVEQAELEHREQADRPRADDQNVGLDGLTHALVPGTGRSLLRIIAPIRRDADIGNFDQAQRVPPDSAPASCRWWRAPPPPWRKAARGS